MPVVPFAQRLLPGHWSEQPASDRPASMLPIEDKKWELHSGIDLERGPDVVAEKLKAIGGIEEINHISH